MIVLKDKVSLAVNTMKEVTKDSLLWSKQRMMQILPERETIVSKSDDELLMDRYKEALQQVQIADQNFELATGEYIEVAIMELKSKELMLNTILKELKTRRIIE